MIRPLIVSILCFGVVLCQSGIEFSHDPESWRPLYEVVLTGDESKVRELIRNGADVNSLDDGHNTPLHFAANAGLERIVGLLIQNGANLNILNQDNSSALHFATNRGHDKVAKLLIQSGANVNAANKFGETPLHSAVSRGNKAIVRLLLQNGANVDATNKFGDTALHFAANEGHEEIVDMLIGNGAQVNLANKNLDTALHFASFNGKGNIVRALLHNSAVRDVKNDHGKTPTDLAREKGHENIVAMLQDFSIADRACIAYTKLITDEILKGHLSEPLNFPWMAALGYLDENYEINFECGGTIISEYFIITAAHCVTAEHRPVVARVGKTIVVDGRRNRAQSHTISEIIPHPNYSNVTRKHDIALIRLTKRFEFTDTVRPACLQTDLRDEDPNENLVVSGWKNDTVNESEPSAIELLQANVTTVSLTECNRTLAETHETTIIPYLQNGIDESQYCAHDSEGLKFTCATKSGAPLQIIADLLNKIKIVGIVSYGAICGSNVPAVYTRIAYYLSWIEPIVWPYGVHNDATLF